MWLYSSLLFFSLIVPFALSFDRKLQFYKSWKFLFPSIFAVAFFYLAFDIYFTKIGVWGFNTQYHLNLLVAGLPLEEWLFFIVVPYSCVFLHESLTLYFPRFRLKDKVSRLLTIILIFLLSAAIVFNPGKAYTAYISSTVIVALIFALFDKTKVIQRYYSTFLVILIPFLTVNAVLTGSFINQEVVWYNNAENLGIRFLTIPVEDFGYAFSLILFNLLLVAKLKAKTALKTRQ